MSKKMLIDAAHPEEVRVALLDNGKIEDFDFESEARKPLRGNIYLARVTRVEPSLQAAFVEYGGNRHGFLAFSEIHPDYYQIPVFDRQKLQAAEAEVAELAAKLELTQRGDEDGDDVDHEDAAADQMEDAQAQEKPRRRRRRKSAAAEADAEASDDEAADDASDALPASFASDDDAIDDDEPASERRSEEEEEEEEDGEEDDDDNVDADDLEASDGDAEIVESDDDDTALDGDASRANAENDEDTISAADADENDEDDDDEDEAEQEEDQSAEARQSRRKERDALIEQYKDAKRRRSALIRNYKIQEVIKRRQILLVQVVKEERGNKGAALTTYLSLAGRYCVLMPNTARGGGISRKIATATDRRRLRRVVDSLEVPTGMGLIIRTAGAKRTKTEIKRDYDYLLRLWENIRTLTLKSIAPCLIYEEASLIKRAIRDLYDKDISKVLVEGENGYREAKDFMKMLMPSHAKHVQPYKERAPIFLKHGVEAQLDGMYQPSVRLKSGGYIVIHQTEALVAIDVNSGRATRERNIELTALKTNLEAAQEAARQFRLRDLAGLIVIDFIDMEETKNNRKVERALKEALKHDRARIQIGRISNFGLLEMSRQRRRSGIVDGTTHSCPTCSGAGVIRSHEMAALRILRAIEGEAISGKVGVIVVKASLDVTLYVLNHHREWLKRIETQNGVSIEITADTGKAGDDFDLEKSGAPREVVDEAAFVRADQAGAIDADEAEIEESQVAQNDKDGESTDESSDEDGGRRRKRRRRRRKDSAEKSDDKALSVDDDAEDAGSDDADENAASPDDDDDNDGKPKRRRRRGRRGGRRNRRTGDDADANADADADEKAAARPAETGGDDEGVNEHRQSGDAADEEPAAKPANGAAEHDSAPEAPDAELATAEYEPSAQSEPTEAKPTSPEASDDAENTEPAPRKSSKKGWWQRTIGG